MPDIAARLEEIFKIPQSASRQSEVDILTQELLKHWKGKETFDGIQNYIKSIPFRNEDPYDSDASDGIMIQKDSSSLNDKLRMRYNSSQDFAQDAPLLTEDPEKEVSRKQSAKEYALLATPTKRLRSESTSIVSESKAKKDQTMTGSDFNAKLDSIMRSDDTESRSSMPLQDNDDEDCDSDTSGSSSSYEEPERPPQQIRRNESKKRGGYIHPVESEKDRSDAGARIINLILNRWTRWTSQYSPTRKARDDPTHFTLVTSITTPANKIYAKLWIRSFKGLGWTRLQFQTLMVDHCMPSSRYHGPSAPR